MRILFVKTSSLGDVVHNCPAVSDVRISHPEATIDWVVEETFAGIVSMHSAIRKVIPVAVRRWRRSMIRPSVWDEMLAFRRSLRAERYDLIIDSQGLLKSALIALLGHGVRHGFDAGSARERIACRFYDVRHPVARDLHAVERNRHLTAKTLSLSRVGPCDYGLAAPSGSPLQITRRYCVFLSMTSRSDKLWPEEHWVGLVKELDGRGFTSVLPWGSEPERLRCNRIASRAGAGVVPHALKIEELASLMTGSQAVVGLDSGLAHLAAALNIPTVGLFVSSNPRFTGLFGTGGLANLGGLGQLPSVKLALDALEDFL